MKSLLWFAIALTRAWTSLYTRGLPGTLRAERREEIDCDLWEHQRLAELQREPVTGTAVQILLRLVLGVPADVVWRMEAGSAASERGTHMNESVLKRGLLAIALAVAAFPLVIGVLVTLGLNGETSDTERLLFGPVQVLVGSAIIAGLLASLRNPPLGIGLVALGVTAISVMWYWVAVITVPIGLGLVAIAFFRSRRPGWPRGTRPA